MRWFFKSKDGGPESTVTGYWLVESKRWGSVVLLRFRGASRPVFHTHAFNALSWLLKGCLTERFAGIGWVPPLVNTYLPSLIPFRTPREYFHKVDATEISWVLSFRGPWAPTWEEYDPITNIHTTLSHGRTPIG